ncbi:MAG: YggS family pyridoxal phosphate-dependent enzyme [Herpetosiphonaceae bacterium]|nr:YggS family pyridoxal phosphate-dependent enzyme [Herpetosiphonaceae bacterium]
MERINEIAQCIAEVRTRITEAAQVAGRDPGKVTLVAVTKTHPARLVAAAFAAGVRDVGENRLQEAEEKSGLLAAERGRLRWHLIGPLQRNKARKAAALFDMVHSVDSLSLAEALNRHVEADSLVGLHRLPVLLQISLAGEPQKAGFVLHNGQQDQANFPTFLREVEAIIDLRHLDLQGLMTVPPFDPDPEASRRYFAQLRDLRDDLARRYPHINWQHLSMGMSGDFPVAVEEGATLVRVGSAIFGARG